MKNGSIRQTTEAPYWYNGYGRAASCLGRKMIGLKRGSVELSFHQKEWDKNAENVILGVFPPLIFRRVQNGPPDERKEGDAMMITYFDLVQTGIFIVFSHIIF